MKTPQLHGHFGTIVNYKPIKRRYIYFIRKTADGIPCPDFWEEAFAEMPNYFFIGSVSHDLLYTLNLLLRQVKLYISTSTNADKLQYLNSNRRSQCYEFVL